MGCIHTPPHSVTYCSHSVQYTRRHAALLHHIYTPRVRGLFSRPLGLTHVLSLYNPAGQICAAEASVVKKPSIAGEMSVGMGIWRDNGGQMQRRSRVWRDVTTHMSHVSHSRTNVFSNHVFGGV